MLDAFNVVLGEDDNKIVELFDKKILTALNESALTLSTSCLRVLVQWLAVVTSKKYRLDLSKESGLFYSNNFKQNAHDFSHGMNAVLNNF